MCRRSTDVRFNLEWMPNRYCDRVQRAAVLYPLCGRPAKSPAAIRAMTSRLVWRWRGRLAALMDQGWRPRPQGHNTFLRNCVPSFVYATPRTCPCKLDWICPFCYARWVQRVWTMVDGAFPNPRVYAEEQAQAQLQLDVNDAVLNRPPDDAPGILECGDGGRPLRSVQLDSGARAAATFPFHLIERVQTHHTAIIPPEDVREQYPTSEAWLRFMLKTVAQHRGKFMTRMLKEGQLEGGLYATTVEPGDGFWIFKHRQLLMVPANNHPVLPESGKTRLYERPTRSAIFAAVAHVCRYPTLLMEADPIITNIYLQARRVQVVNGKAQRTPRLVGTFGSFRSTRGH